jgi:catechol 2,3-dioxygenase-like lactoylglutathione lyase family enzyme
MTMRFLFLIPALASMAWGQQVEVTGVAGARFRVGDIEKAREFYTRIFGFQEVQGPAPNVLTFRVRADQYLEFSAARGDRANPLEMIFFVGSPQEAALRDPEGRMLYFGPTSATSGFQRGAAGISDHLLHVGMGVKDMRHSIDFYGGRLLCKEIFRRPDGHVLIMRVPGEREDWIEFILRGEQGSDHICLDVPDIQKAYQTLLGRGATIQGKPRIASNGHWVINMLDTNGIRVELMEPQAAK